MLGPSWQHGIFEGALLDKYRPLGRKRLYPFFGG